MIQLGVNIDHVATVRNARGTAYPSPQEAALVAEAAGADLITVHLREDRRHIRDADVAAVQSAIHTRLNLEMALTEEMLAHALKVRPQDVCIVPERREEVTTEGGLDVRRFYDRTAAYTQKLLQAGIRVSIFIDPDREQIRLAHELGAPVIEIHTGRYADATTVEAQQEELQRITEMVEYATSLGLVVNAGHGLHYDNVQAIAALPAICELNIGHSIVARALFVGLAQAVAEMKALMLAARNV